MAVGSSAESIALMSVRTKRLIPDLESGLPRPVKSEGWEEPL